MDIIQQTLEALNNKDSRALFTEARRRKEDMSGEAEADMNIRNQINKVIDTNGKYEIVFKRGKGRFSKAEAEAMIKALDMLKPRERGMVQDEITKSKKEMDQFLEVAKELTESEYPEEHLEFIMERRDWGSMSKSQFKRAELEHELRGEDNKKTGEVKKIFRFYKIDPDQEEAARAQGLMRTKSGKWAHVVTVSNYGGDPQRVVKQLKTKFKDRYNGLDKQFGKGAMWSPERALAQATKNFI